MKRLFVPIFVTLFVLGTQLSAQSVAEAMQLVRDTCSRAKDEGSLSTLSAKGEVEGSVRIKLVGKVGGDAFVEVTQKKWDSINQVNADDQLADNLDYRICVKELTPVVLDARE